MKLGEALSHRAELQVKIGELRSRIRANAIAQEGSLPGEDPTTLINILEGIHDELGTLIARINLTNAHTEHVTSSGLTETLTGLLARRDTLAGLKASLSSAADAALPSDVLYSFRRATSELRVISHINVEDLRQRADQAQEELKKLDNLIQELNWKTELI